MMGANGATVAHASGCHRPIAIAPSDGTLIRFWCRSEAAPIFGYRLAPSSAAGLSRCT